MNRRVGAALAALSTSAGLVIAVTAPAIATPAPAQPDATSMLAATARDLGLTPDQVRARLATDAAASAAERGLSKRIGTAYAGAWLSTGSARLTVAVTGPAYAAEVRAAGAQPVLVTRSLAQLDAVKSALDRAARPDPRAVAAWYVDVASNSVVILALDAAAGRAFASSAASSAAASSTAVRVVATTQRPHPLYDVRGGDAFYIGGGRCSIGFSVAGGFVTAGHCGDAGTPAQGYNQVGMGTFRGSSFPGNDYSWVQVNSSWTPRGVVNDYAGGTVTVSGSQEASVGAAICRSGSTTGLHCGTIQAKNTTVNYAEGTVTGLTRTNVCAEPGDSGGSWISGSQAQGVTSGGSGDCTSGGTTYFQPVNEILSAYGLTLVTGGGTPTPPPTGCTESTYTGSVSEGASQYRPNSSGVYVSAAGTHRACLDGPSGADFDLYLQKRSGSSWVTVASATSEEPDETLTYSGTAGYYRYRVHAYDGSGGYTLRTDAP